MEEKEIKKIVPEAGAFMESLKRNNRQIRSDRAEAIGEDAEMQYKRQVEDYDIQITRMKRQMENMLDLSPSHAQSLKLAEDFNADEYVQKDVDLGMEIWKVEQRLAIAKARYTYLFGVELKSAN